MMEKKGKDTYKDIYKEKYNISTLRRMRKMLTIWLCAILLIPCLQTHADELLQGTVIATSSWIGLDLGQPHVLTRVGWVLRNENPDAQCVQLAVFEGANSPDFMDALPLYMVTNEGVVGQMAYADIACSKGFRYVRYVKPDASECIVAEVEFYGHAGEGDNTRLVQLTNLPTVSIHVVNDEEPYDKEHELRSYVSVISNDGATLLQDSALVRLRGNGSLTFPKRPYRIKFDKKQNVLDAPAKARKWTLINNYGDKTLMRNQLAFEISRRLEMPYTPFCAYVDVLVNGKYKGTYQLCDQVQVHSNRVNVDEMTPNDKSGTALTGGYLIEADAYANQETNMFYSKKGTGVTIKSPDEDEIIPEQYEYIKSAYNRMESNWRETLDLSTFLRHFLVGEVSGNTDTYWSVFFYKRRNNDTIYTGPVWDFDLAFENDVRTYPINNNRDWIFNSTGSVTGYMKTLVNQVIQDPTGKAELKAIWAHARENGLTAESMNAYIDQQAELLEASQRLNFIRWPIMNEKVHKNPRIWGSYEAEVRNVKTFMQNRIQWMDKKLDYTYVPKEAIDNIEQHAINWNEPYAIYSILGERVTMDVVSLPKGVYIVSQGPCVQKIMIP